MAFGINREELNKWKHEVKSGKIAFLTHYWIHPRFPQFKTVTKVGCNDLNKLITWGKKYGLKEEWIDHRPLFPHFDLIGIKQVEILYEEGLAEHVEKFKLPAMNEQHRYYAIYLEVPETVSLQIGKLGMFEFPKGTYIYVGSAKRTIKNRILRHIKKEKPLRWHFDYLRPYGEITSIETFNDQIDECSLANRIKKNVQAIEIVKGFGSSDCKCKSHLLFLPNELS